LLCIFAEYSGGAPFSAPRQSGLHDVLVRDFLPTGGQKLAKPGRIAAMRFCNSGVLTGTCENQGRKKGQEKQGHRLQKASASPRPLTLPWSGFTTM
jgi:hypothetical protein